MTEEKLNEFGGKQNSVETEHVKCSGCGANMEFNPENQVLICPHCGNKVEFNTQTQAQEIDITAGFNSENNWQKDEATVFKCDNCGAQVVLNNGQTASSCPFCGTPHVQRAEELAGLKPNAVLPFTFGVDKAIEFTKKWVKRLFYAKKAFKKRVDTDHVKGVYAPCFTFDSYTTSSYVGRIGKTYTRTVGSGKNRRTETYTVWRDIAGTYYDSFDDVLITAGSKFDQKKMDKLSPFDTNSSKSYEGKYLLGYMAYRYDYELEDCWSNAKNIMDRRIERGILSQYSYDKVAYLNVSTSHERVTYKYVMLPVYVGSIPFNKKSYNFYINGNTGKVWGQYPKSFWKILFTVLLGLGIIAGIVLLVNLS